MKLIEHYSRLRDEEAKVTQAGIAEFKMPGEYLSFFPLWSQFWIKECW